MKKRDERPGYSTKVRERAGLIAVERERLKVLERENREFRQANEVLLKASAHFAQVELDRRIKP